MSSSDDNEGVGADGEDFVSYEIGLGVPVNGEADEFGVRTDEVLCSSGFLSEIDDVNITGVRCDRSGDELEAKRREETDIFQVIAIGVNAEDVFEHKCLYRFLLP